MKSQQWVKLIVVGASVLALTACSKPGNKAGNPLANSQSGLARTYPLTGQKAYAGYRRNALGEIINPLRAPANQTYYFAFDSSSLTPKG